MLDLLLDILKLKEIVGKEREHRVTLVKDITFCDKMSMRSMHAM
jgi:hypothetical protein